MIPEALDLEPTIWSFLDIEETPEGWWVFRSGATVSGGVPIRKPLRLFLHSRLDPGAARYAAHCHAFNLSNLTDRRYLA